MNNLKSRIQSGEAVHGCWINMGSLVSAEIVGRAGFEWVLIDLEHGAGDAAIMYNQLQVLAGLDTTPIVRIDDITRPNVQHILDAGASGIMFPQVQNEEEAEAAIKMMYYPPHGIRGTARAVRAMGFGRNSDAYVANLDKILLGIIQIETVSALKHIDAIAAVDGVDVLFVGPFDLTTALGIFGQLDHMLYQQAIRDVADAARKYGKATGVLLRDPKEYEMYHDLGYRFLACGADGAFVTKGADEMVKQLNSYKSK
jgi:2-keto-3-deoxy-L-rhamnonate aldolase RhmA